MTEIRHIVFDIGKVLVHYDPDLPFSRLIPDEAERKWFFDNVCTSAWNIEQDRGRTWEKAEAELLAVHPDHAENIRNFRRHWHEMVPYAYDDSVVLMEQLIDAGHDVTLLTNWAADTFIEARSRFPFLDKPRGITVSGEIRAIKPERAIYDHHVKAFDLEPAATIFIDDSQKNVDGAKAAGWQAVLFTDALTLRKDLGEVGIQAMSDPIDVLRRWHEAINALDFDAVAAFFADDATYGSRKVGALRGKEQIMKAFRDYFAEYPDQVAVDDSFEKVGPAAAKSTWHLTATSATTGKKLVRKGEETIYLNAEGKIERVDVLDQ